MTDPRYCPLPSNDKTLDLLTEELRRVRSMGFVNSVGLGSGKVGLTLEYHLGIAQNTSKSPDFSGIELKAKAVKPSSKKADKGSITTLFSAAPELFLGCIDRADLLGKFGYYDPKRDRQALYTSINSAGDSLGFRLKCLNDTIVIESRGIPVIGYRFASIEKWLGFKHSKTMFVSAVQRGVGVKTEFWFNEAIFCEDPTIENFVQLVREGSIFYDFTLSQKDKKIKDHGFLWRLDLGQLVRLFKKVSVVALGS